MDLPGTSRPVDALDFISVMLCDTKFREPDPGKLAYELASWSCPAMMVASRDRNDALRHPGGRENSLY